jgi:hypothetical protein
MKRPNKQSPKNETLISIRILMVNDVLIAYGIRTREEREKIFEMSMHELEEKWKNRPAEVAPNETTGPSPTP